MRILFLLLAGLAACANATPGDTTPIKVGGGGAGGKPGTAADVSLDIGLDVKGVYFEPQALGLPGMPIVGAKKKMTLEKHRDALAKTKDPVIKQAEAAIIATMLYEKSKAETGDAQQKTLTDARQTLRDVASAVGDKVDELTLQLLGTYELTFKDYPAAEKAWAQLVAMVPKSKEEPEFRAWWVYSLFLQGKNAEALEAIKAEPAPLSEKHPELAYAAAWAKWRGGDAPGAWQAMLLAIKGWGQANKEALDYETLVFAGHSNIPMQQEIKDLLPLYAGKDQTLAYKLYADLGLKAYASGGRWTDAIAALEKALEIEGNKVLPHERTMIRYEEADYMVRLDDPATAAKYGKQALDALGPCGDKCEKDRENVIEGIGVAAKLFYIAYATAHDDRYFQPSHDLYDAAIPLFANDKIREPAVMEKNQLETWQKNFNMKDKAGAGTHDKGAITALLQRHNQEVAACYENQLTANGKLAGNLIVNLESDQSGAIKGVSTEPKAGMADMSAVAGCVAERAKSWKLPKTANGNVPHSTRIKVTFALSKK
jgi:tetratricopeptide (TPR) repeat protein